MSMSFFQEVRKALQPESLSITKDSDFLPPVLHVWFMGEYGNSLISFWRVGCTHFPSKTNPKHKVCFISAYVRVSCGVYSERELRRVSFPLLFGTGKLLFFFFNAFWAAALLCNLDLQQKIQMLASIFCTKMLQRPHCSCYSPSAAKGRFELSWLVNKKPKLWFYHCRDPGCKSQKDGAAVSAAALGNGWSAGEEICSLPLKHGDFQLLMLQLDAKSYFGSCQQNVEWV